MVLILAIAIGSATQIGRDLTLRVTSTARETVDGGLLGSLSTAPTAGPVCVEAVTGYANGAYYGALRGSQHVAAAAQVPASWTADMVLAVARIAEGVGRLDADELVVLGCGETALLALQVAQALGKRATKTAPRNRCPACPFPFLVLDDVETWARGRDLGVVDLAGREDARSSRYISLVAAATRTALEEGLLADPVDAPDFAPDDEKVAAKLAHLADVLSSLERRAPARSAFNPLAAAARLKLGATAADEFLDNLDWPRDVDTGKRFGLDALLPPPPVAREIMPHGRRTVS